MFITSLKLPVDCMCSFEMHCRNLMNNYMYSCICNKKDMLMFIVTPPDINNRAQIFKINDLLRFQT